MGKLDELAAQGKECQVALSDAMLNRIADLTLRLHQQAAREAGAILPPHMMRTFSERPDSERAGMRSAVQHVIIALVLLDIIDQPGA